MYYALLQSMTDCITISGVSFLNSMLISQHYILFAEQTVAKTNENKCEGQISASQFFPDVSDLCKLLDVSADSCR